jgi:hypothetical protein
VFLPSTGTNTTSSSSSSSVTAIGQLLFSQNWSSHVNFK